MLPRDGDGVVTLDAENNKVDSWYWPPMRREEFWASEAPPTDLKEKT